MKFEVGDIVKLKNYSLDEIPDLWVDEMYNMCGKEVRIFDISDQKLSIEFENEHWWIWMDDVAEIVKHNGEEGKSETKEFTKEDLKDGMIVEYRNGSRRLVIKTYDALLGFNEWGDLNDYYYDLTTTYKGLDIMKVYSIRVLENLSELLSNDKLLSLIWERDEPKEMTLEEIESELGYKIKFVEDN